MPYPMKRKLSSVEQVISETLDGFFPTSFDQDKLAKIIWDKIKLNFPEMKVAEEIIKEYDQDEVNNAKERLIQVMKDEGDYMFLQVSNG